MNTIDHVIGNAQGFDPAKYDALLKQAKAEKVDVALVEALVAGSIKRGQSFDKAVDQLMSQIPNMKEPGGSAAALKEWIALPSPGALIMQVTTEYAAEQRKGNRQEMWSQTEAIAASMEAEADKMREAAVTQLVMGVVSGAVSIAAGVMQMRMSANVIKSAGSMDQARLTAANAMSGAVGSMGQAASGIISAAGQYLATQAQAEMKEMQADQEKMRAVRDSIKSLNDALSELIQKSLAAQNAIQESTNQTRGKILA